MGCDELEIGGVGRGRLALDRALHPIVEVVAERLPLRADPLPLAAVLDRGRQRARDDIVVRAGLLPDTVLAGPRIFAETKASHVESIGPLRDTALAGQWVSPFLKGASRELSELLGRSFPSRPPDG
ncbi:MAG TPA: hypothetical protein VNL16_06425 [Chloroflexota bacterium]|nr:hypothetical protein [Chloroflexota bacterium]